MSHNSVQDLIIVLDESGSMGEKGSEPLKAVNNFISEQKLVLGDDGASFTLWTFSSIVKKIIDDKPLNQVDRFYEYLPSGSTSLFDAIGMAISTKLGKDKSTSVICLIITDGQDNTSRMYNSTQIAEMIKDAEDNYNWKFIFLGAGKDVFKDCSKININKDMCAEFGNTPGDLVKVTRHISENIATYRSDSTNAALSVERAVSYPIFCPQKQPGHNVHIQQSGLKPPHVTRQKSELKLPRVTRQ